MTAASGGPVEPSDLVRRWQEAENKLYPIVMVRPEAYAAAVTLVRAVADRLAHVQSLEDLVVAYETSAQLVADAVRETGVSAEGLDLGLVAGAAFNAFYRDLRGALQREQAKQRIREAAAAGSDWVVLFEAGRPEFVMLTPYRRLEMRLADGLGLHASIMVDPSTGRPTFEVEVVQLDPVTGDWINEAKPAGSSATYQTQAEWERAIVALRGEDRPPNRT